MEMAEELPESTTRYEKYLALTKRMDLKNEVLRNKNDRRTNETGEP